MGLHDTREYEIALTYGHTYGVQVVMFVDKKYSVWRTAFADKDIPIRLGSIEDQGLVLRQLHYLSRTNPEESAAIYVLSPDPRHIESDPATER